MRFRVATTTQPKASLEIKAVVDIEAFNSRHLPLLPDRSLRSPRNVERMPPRATSSINPLWPHYISSAAILVALVAGLLRLVFLGGLPAVCNGSYD